MYKAYVDGIILYDPAAGHVLGSPKLTLELNKVPSFEFTIYPGHQAYGLLKRMKSIVTVEDGAGNIAFRGRVLDDETGFRDAKKVTCEGDMAFLLDSIVRPYDHQGTITQMLTDLVTQHNAQVEEAKRFEVGRVTVTDTNDYIHYSSTTYPTTWDELNDKLIDTHGGYLFVRHEDGKAYLDYLSDFDLLSNQPIRFGQNLLDLTRTTKGADVVTAILPLGKRGETVDGVEGKRLTIADVNGGKDYVQDDEAVGRYGFICKTMTWDDVTDAQNLLRKGREELAKAVQLQSEITLSAADLSALDTSFSSFRLGTYVKVVSEPHGLDVNLLVNKLSIDLGKPASNKLSLGASWTSLTEQQGDANKVIDRVETIITNVKRTVSSITVEYYLSTSSASTTGGEWSATAPDWTAGSYIWTRTKTAYSDGTTSYSEPVCMTGAPGKDGQDGKDGADGTPGPAGTSTYFHVAYANSADGRTDFSTSDATGRAYMGTYVDTTQADSGDPTKYEWALIKGQDGEDGAPGKNGADGKTYYLHIAYATNSTGTEGFSTTDGSGKTYLGQCVDTTQADPTTPSSYMWTLIKGEKGDRGLQGLQGEQGADGIPGKAGADGKSSYTHIAYANSEDGRTDFSVSDSDREYIGMYVDFTQADSSDPTDYAWSRIKGADGADGTPGKAGADGKTPYLHIAYANSSDGSSGFSTTDSANKLYIGQYTDFTQADSSDHTKYSWTRIKGETGAQGPQGVPGPAGEDGQSLYTWVKYADTPTSGMSDSPTGKEYMGIAYNKTSSNESSNYGDYTWSLIKGTDGVRGPAGEDGQTLYTWVKYADSASGSGMSDSPTGKEYMGLAYNKTSATESTDPSDYTWSLIKGADGTSVTVSSTVTNYAVSSSGTTAPSSGWASSIPSVSSGQYLWTRVVTTYSDGKKSTAYSVARQGEDGAPGSSVTVTSTTTEYNAHTSGTSIPTDAWSTSIPSVPEGQYLWTRVITKYSDGKTATAYSVARQGQDGADGTSVTVTSTKTEYQTSSSGTSVPTGTWSTSIPSVDPGKYLWTRVTVTYSDGKQAVSYSVSRNGTNGTNGQPGADGEDGRGIKSTTVAYQAGSSQTTPPTGTWTSEIPTLGTAKPYLWTRITLTYTDGGTTTSYSVSSTLDGFEIGGRNFFVGSGKLGGGSFTKLSGSQPNEFETGTDESVPSGNYVKVSGVPLKIYISNDVGKYIAKMVEGDTYTVSLWMKSNKDLPDKNYAFDCEFLTTSKRAEDRSISTGWKRLWITGAYNGNTTSRVAIIFYNDDLPEDIEMYFSSVKVERGNKPTDWTPAPEDTDTAIDTAKEELSQNLISLIDQTQTSIMSQVAEQYYLKDDADALVSSIGTRFEQTKEDFTFTFNQFEQDLESLANGTDAKFTDISKYIRFVDGNIILGETGNEITLRIENDRISFLENNLEVAYMSNQKLYITTGEIINRLQIGRFAWYPRSNGNLTLRYSD